MEAASVGDRQPSSAARRYDLELFERLNEEYRGKPISSNPPGLDPRTRARRARRELRKLSRQLDVNLSGRRVLEIGCAHGQLTSLLVRKGGAREAIGVDVEPSPAWAGYSDERVRFHVADLSTDGLLPPGYVDAVVSNAVLEHVRRPLQMLEAVATALRVGGRAWLRFNLHRGPLASHRYREVFFPWPHLLFEPSVCTAFYRKHHREEVTFSWVNRMTLSEYLAACREVGLDVERWSREVADFDVAFYRRFEDRLGAYPALDLETNFLTLVLRKRRRPRGRVQSLPYVERQRALERALEKGRATID